MTTTLTQGHGAQLWPKASGIKLGPSTMLSNLAQSHGSQHLAHGVSFEFGSRPWAPHLVRGPVRKFGPGLLVSILHGSHGSQPWPKAGGLKCGPMPLVLSLAPGHRFQICSKAAGPKFGPGPSL